MTRVRTRSRRALIATAVALLASTWSTGASLAQDDHEHDVEHGHDDPAPEDRGDGASQPDEQTTVVQYGPYDIEGASGDGHHGHAHSGDQIELGIEKPCDDCYITGMRPDLVTEAGESVGISTGPMLHHMVLFNDETGRSDATCVAPVGLLGQRFFASGDERTPVSLPEGYGYRVGDGSWNFIWDLANHSTEPQTVYYQVTFDWVPAAEADLTDVEPVWFDVDQCADSTVELPAGQSTADWTWPANRSGEMVLLFGHQHGNSADGGGDHLTVTNETTGEELCDSVAGYGETPMYVDHHEVEWLSSMSVCGGGGELDVLGAVNEGDQVTVTGYYDQIEATDDQMGIAIGYMVEDAPGDGGGSEEPPGDDGASGGNGGVATAAPPIRGEPGFTG